MKQILHIGIDDTDSSKGMCTTFLAYKIINRLKKEKASVDHSQEKECEKELSKFINQKKLFAN